MSAGKDGKGRKVGGVRKEKDTQTPVATNMKNPLRVMQILSLEKEEKNSNDMRQGNW